MFFEYLIVSTHLLVRAVQYWLFAKGFNLVLLKKQADYQNVSKYFNLTLLQKTADHRNKTIKTIIKSIQELVAFVLKSPDFKCPEAATNCQQVT